VQVRTVGVVGVPLKGLTRSVADITKERRESDARKSTDRGSCRILDAVSAGRTRREGVMKRFYDCFQVIDSRLKRIELCVAFYQTTVLGGTSVVQRRRQRRFVSCEKISPTRPRRG